MEPKKIVLRMPNWLGDFIMALPALDNIKHKWPNAHMAVICSEFFKPLIEDHSSIDQFILFKDKRSSRFLHEKLTKESFDLGILLTHSFSSAWSLFRGGVKNRWGLRKDFRSLLLTKSFSKAREKKHQVLDYLDLLVEMGIPSVVTTPSLSVSSSSFQGVKDKFFPDKQEGDIYIGIHPSAAYGPAKMWPLEYFKSLGSVLLRNPKIHLIYLGDLKGKEISDDIISSKGVREKNLCGQTDLKELTGVMKHLDVFVTNDSGPMHIAAALKVPLVALFGSTDPFKTSPYSWGRVVYNKVDCSPCFKRECPIDFRCMRSITPDRVYAEIYQELILSNKLQ